MINKPIRARALQLGASLTLCALAASAQADPINLQGTCHLTSIIATQGKCELIYFLGDAATSGPATIARSVVKVDGIIVARYINDIANPELFSVPTVSGGTAVACGVTHIVTAFILRVGVGQVFTKVGSLPDVLCPVAP